MKPDSNNMLLREYDYMNNRHHYKANCVIAVEKYIDNKWKDCNIIIITRHVNHFNREETRQDRHLSLQKEKDGSLFMLQRTILSRLSRTARLVNKTHTETTRQSHTSQPYSIVVQS